MRAKPLQSMTDGLLDNTIELSRPSGFEPLRLKPFEAHFGQIRRFMPWCARRDSNPHDFTHCHLKAARLPIPPRALKEIGTGKAGPDQRRRCNKSGMEGQGLEAYRTPGDFGSICLTSTAIRLRSTSTTPLAIGRLLARILTSSASVASSSMMAPRLRRIT